MTGRQVHHMPEFLTERTYIEDFKWQPMVFTGDIELLKKIFPGKKHIDMTSEEAEMVKYAHNVFGALKVTYFNCVYDLCKRNGSESKILCCHKFLMSFGDKFFVTLFSY